MDTIREALEVPQPDPSGLRRPAWTGRADLPALLLRGGLAFAFLYAATASFLHPTTFARYFPSFIPGTWSAELLPAFAVYEVVLSALLLTNRFTYVASMLAAATLLGIVVANPDAFEVLFRNVAIACAAVALALQDRQQRVRPDPPRRRPP